MHHYVGENPKKMFGKGHSLLSQTPPNKGIPLPELYPLAPEALDPGWTNFVNRTLRKGVKKPHSCKMSTAPKII